MQDHTLLAYAAAERGLGKLEIDAHRLAADLEQNWEVLAEAVQQVMRRHGVADAYDKLKELKMTHEYHEIPGGDHGSVIATGMPDIFAFFSKHSR